MLNFRWYKLTSFGENECGWKMHGAFNIDSWVWWVGDSMIEILKEGKKRIWIETGEARKGSVKKEMNWR